MIGQLEALIQMLKEAQDRRAGITPMQLRMREADPVMGNARGQGPMPFRDPSQMGPSPPTRDQLAAMLPRAR